MLEPDNIPPVTEDEDTTRFVFFSGHIRRSDLSLRPEAFIPSPHTELSIMRKLAATEEEIWAAGRAIGVIRQKTLKGRADRFVHAYTRQGLMVDADPVDGNPNHAIVVNWNDDKAKQLMVAVEIARDATCLMAESI